MAYKTTMVMMLFLATMMASQALLLA